MKQLMGGAGLEAIRLFKSSSFLTKMYGNSDCIAICDPLIDEEASV